MENRRIVRKYTCADIGRAELELGFRKCELTQQGREDRAGRSCDGEEGLLGFRACIPISSSPIRSDLRNPGKSRHTRSQFPSEILGSKIHSLEEHTFTEDAPCDRFRARK